MFFNASTHRKEVFEAVAAYIRENGFHVESSDHNRPWGGFFVLEEGDADRFIEQFFPGYTKEQLMIGEKLSPKFLVVAPDKRLSWQYHFRRAEIWSVLSGPVKVATNSFADDEVEPKTYEEGEIIVLQKGERHRLIGADNYGIVTEIWQHTDPENPSDEDDIVRLQDDFGR
jgi:mannose-6-phosphate isomerase-like protein (cupin superfamily)